jgi:hypothetical protein
MGVHRLIHSHTIEMPRSLAPFLGIPRRRIAAERARCEVDNAAPVLQIACEPWEREPDARDAINAGDRAFAFVHPRILSPDPDTIIAASHPLTSKAACYHPCRTFQIANVYRSIEDNGFEAEWWCGSPARFVIGHDWPRRLREGRVRRTRQPVCRHGIIL